ncbi:MAG: sulfurtransferase TusA family protein [Rhodospirillales bacterium]|nr:sulfurtransferase TusA family protein [Rhodospirillales bacterium]
MAEQSLDARGLSCPLPILRARRALKAMAEGDILCVRATDPGAVKDFEAFCRATGNTLVQSDAPDGVFRFRIRARGG